jgi:hypothetical protein
VFEFLAVALFLDEFGEFCEAAYGLALNMFLLTPNLLWIVAPWAEDRF